MDPQAAKQQIVDRVKQAENILVTVSANPSVDQLASCIGLSLLLNKMGKSATAVFSGKVPSTLEFLQPEQNLSTSADSLRDFIISLDKAKADKLRYKIEDQIVRIFITPYKSKLTQSDLQFSEGDFNVEVIITLGVTDRASLDTAITAHGRILHDATVVSLIAGQGKAPNLGQINWQDTNASSLAEMLVSLSEAFGPNLVDNQSATAFLTGIVAETDRFSNKKTSPKVMTMSAQLMAAGANQQLVISKLTPQAAAPPPQPPKAQTPPPLPTKPKAEAPKPVPPPLKPQPKPEPPKPKKQEEKPKEEIENKVSSGILNVGHDGTSSDKEEVEINSSEIHIDNQGNLKMIDDGPKTSEIDKGQDKEKDEEKDKENAEKPDKKDKPEEEPKKEEKAEIKLPDPMDPPPVAEVHLVMPPPTQSHDMPPPPAPPPPPAEQKPPEVLPPPPIPKMEPAPPPPPAPDSPKLNDLGDLPPLPPPEPIPAIKIGNPSAPHISATAAAPSTMPLPPPPPSPQATAPSSGSGHALLDPLRQPPHLGASFSADTSDGWGGGTGGNLPVDPVNNIPLNPQGGESYSRARQMAPPPPHQSPLDQMLSNPGGTSAPAQPSGGLTTENARQAVESAFSSVPFNPGNNPQAGVGAAPMGPQLHQPPAYDSATPSLSLPTPPDSAPPAPPPPTQSPPPAAPPPPGPPPFMPPPTL
jgi:hypothetical protein